MGLSPLRTIGASAGTIACRWSGLLNGSPLIAEIEKTIGRPRVPARSAQEPDGGVEALRVRDTRVPIARVSWPKRKLRRPRCTATAVAVAVSVAAAEAAERVVRYVHRRHTSAVDVGSCGRCGSGADALPLPPGTAADCQWQARPPTGELAPAPVCRRCCGELVEKFCRSRLMAATCKQGAGASSPVGGAGLPLAICPAAGRQRAAASAPTATPPQLPDVSAEGVPPCTTGQPLAASASNGNSNSNGVAVARGLLNFLRPYTRGSEHGIATAERLEPTIWLLADRAGTLGRRDRLLDLAINGCRSATRSTCSNRPADARSSARRRGPHRRAARG